MKATKSIWARMMVLCLTVAMVLSVVTMGAFAEPVNEDDQTGTVTINSSTSVENVTVNLYKIIDVNMDKTTNQPKDPVYLWNSEVSQWVDDNYAGYIDKNNNNAVTDEFKEATTAELSKFFQAMDKAMTPVKSENPEEEAKPELEITCAKTTSLTGNSQTINGVGMGQYLVIATKSAYVFSPATVTVTPTWSDKDKKWVADNASVTLKGKGGIDKTVTGGDLQYAVGDTVNYRLDVVIPDYPEDATATKFNVGDKMGIGLTWDKAVTVYWSTDGTIKTTTEGEGEDQKVVYDPAYIVADSYYTLATPGPDDATFEVQFNYKGLVAKYSTAKYIHVVYNATLNEDAFTTDSLGNDAYLGVNTDPYDGGSYKTTDTHEQVYTYGINVTKVDADKPDTTLAGAEFTLKDSEGQAIQFAKTSDGVYVKYDADNYTKEDAVTPVTTLVVANNGTLQIKGVDVDTYTLTETKAPGGYQLPNDEAAVTTIVMKDDEKGTGEETVEGQDGNLDNSSATGAMIVDKVNASGNVISFKLKNAKPGFELPTTGGMGTVLFTAGGLIIMACGAALVLVTLKKKKAED